MKEERKREREKEIYIMYIMYIMYINVYNVYNEQMYIKNVYNE